MEIEQTIMVIMGCLFLLVAGLLAFVKVDRKQLVEYVHSFPGLALFRFPAFRWGTVVVFLIIGLVCVLIGLGKIF